MFRFWLFSVIVIVGCVMGSISDFSEEDIKDSPNEIYNSGFEQYSVGINSLPGWTILEEATDYVKLVNNDFNSGQNSLRISSPRKKVSLISDSFQIDPESVYFTRLFVKSNYKSNHHIDIKFVAFDVNGKKVNVFNKKYYPDNIWTKANLTTGFFKQNARFARIIITFPAREDKVFWLDDVESYKVYKLNK